MLVLDPNNVKIYNLSAGKSLPEWISDRKRRALQKKNVDIRKRIQLIQDFDMPAVSTSVKVSPDGNYILATGIYKPRVRCYDVNNLSMKFERCFDSEVVTFHILSEDYSKLVFLHNDRNVEFHAAYGRYYRLRIPRFGRDMQYNTSTCDLYLVGASPDVYRLNLEQGQFLSPLVTEASEVNCCAINPVHQLFVCGTQEGKVEAWDPRTRNRVGMLDCAFSITDTQLEGFPSVTRVQFDGGLTLGVGTATGQVLLYDIRSNKTFCIKDHMYGLPIRDIEFHSAQHYVISMDSSVIRIWHQDTGKLVTSIEGSAEFNGLCVVPNTGMIFAANEDTKIQTYYIPSLGPAPRWCSFLDSLTEELEESHLESVYDDYKFVTRQELQELGLDHLLGTSLLRAYMHGFFVDIRLYRKAKSVVEPFAFEEYKKKKIREKIEETRTNRVKLQSLPRVNKDLALKLINEDLKEKKKKNKIGASLLKDDRFKVMFENPDFEVDKNAEEYRLLNPVLSKLDRSTKKELKKQLRDNQFEEIEGHSGNEESSSEFDSSSDDDQQWMKELKRQHYLLKQEAQEQEAAAQPKFFELKEGEDFKALHRNTARKWNKYSLGQRVEQEDKNCLKFLKSRGSREMTFTVGKTDKFSRFRAEAKKHHDERRKLLRPTRNLPLSRLKFK